MQTQIQIQKQSINLKGSAQIVSQFFQFACNNILYQRGIYPPEAFETKKQYGLALWQTTDDALSKYMNSVLQQSKSWLEEGHLRQLVLVVTAAISKEVMERWTFDIETSKEATGGASVPERPEKEVTSEIQAIMRQITASVTFLPLLETRCTIDILCYTNPIDQVPEEWEDSDPRAIANPEVVSLRGFKTNIHGVKTMVTYKQNADEVL